MIPLRAPVRIFCVGGNASGLNGPMLARNPRGASHHQTLRSTMRILQVLAVGLITLGTTLAAGITPNYGKPPLTFEPNRGQADQRTVYLARGTGYLVSLESSGSRVLLRKGGKSAEISSRLVGGAGTSHLEPLDPLPGHSSYFRGRERSHWLTGIPNFARVRAVGVYPGIHLIYYGNQSRLEYDFVVSPGADPRAIRMRFKVTISLRVADRWHLSLSTPPGEITVM